MYHCMGYHNIVATNQVWKTVRGGFQMQNTDSQRDKRNYAKRGSLLTIL